VFEKGRGQFRFLGCHWRTRPEVIMKTEADFTRRLMAVPKKEIDAQKSEVRKKEATKKRQAA